MCATAANLIERVLPETALRQWVLTFPFPWRRRLAHDGALLGALTRIFVETVHTFYTRSARREDRRGHRRAAHLEEPSRLPYCALPSVRR
jgi:hypothetical protein